MSAVEFQSVSKAYGGRAALDRLSLSVDAGGFTVVCGPPKSGKSVLFRLLVGLETVDSGRILLEGRDITEAAPGDRPIGYVPQSFALYPHRSVHDNIAYPLHLAGTARETVAAKVDRTAGMLSITHLLAKTPDQLSGGEKQRVAVARGLIRDAQVFVLDDPLVGLDYKLRERLMDELKTLCAALKTTFLYATSDSLEALTLAQAIVVLDGGRLVEQAPAIEVYRQPRTLRGLEVVGFPRANILPGDRDGGDVRLAGVRFALPQALADQPGRRLALGIRPEDVRVRPDPAGAGRLMIVEHLGAEIVLYARQDGLDLTSAGPAGAGGPPAIDSAVSLSIDPEAVMVFDADSGDFLGRCTHARQGG